MSAPPIFIIGLPRSGSTLWSNVIDEHPDVALFNEMHYLSCWHKDFRSLVNTIGDLTYDENVRRLVDRIFSQPVPVHLHHGFYFWRSLQKLQHLGLPEILVQRVLDSDDRQLGFIFRVLIEEATRLRGKSRAAVKFPVHPAYMEKLFDWWPEAYLVHISRDPRSLAASKTNDPGGTVRMTGRYPRIRYMLPYIGMSVAIFQYVWTSRTHKKMEKYLNYRLFLYEDLLREPETTVKRLCDFCDLEFHASMLNPDAGQPSSVTGSRSRGFDRSRMHGWNEVLTPWQTRLITFATRGSMKRFGYNPR